MRNNAGECGRYPQARLSALTDLLNRIVLEAAFVPWKQGERSVAAGHLAAMAPEDLAILDRGYACYWLLAQFIAASASLSAAAPRAVLAWSMNCSKTTRKAAA